MNKVAIYVRQSNHSNAAEALEKQKAEVAEYCASKGFEVCDTVGGIGDRLQGFAQFIDMIKNAKEKGFDKIVMKSTNRLVTTTKEYAQLKEKLAMEGIDLDNLGIEIIAMDGTHNALQSSVMADFILNANAEE
ncbi:MAG: recombinase family protein [Bacteroidales bacterium]|nr:recombinase family protein [Bacteroidales bacterium]